MRDIPLRFSIDKGPCQRYRLSLVFCECLQVIIHKGDTDLPYEISPMYRESPLAGLRLKRVLIGYREVPQALNHVIEDIGGNDAIMQ